MSGQNEILDNLEKNLSNSKKCMAQAFHFLEEAENNFSKLTMMLTKVNVSEIMNNVYENYEIFLKIGKEFKIINALLLKK